jgi:hypothetical protein
VADAVALIPNDDVDWNTYNTTLMAIWAASGGEDFESADSWAQKSSKYNLADVMERWEAYSTCPPNQVGWLTLAHCARRADPTGENTSERLKKQQSAGFQGVVDDDKPRKRMFTPVKSFEAKTLPVRPWVVPDLLCRTNITMLAGPGGVAKSTYWIMVAVALAAGRDDICGFDIPKPGRVAMWNQEDPLDELQRRLCAIMRTFNVSWEDMNDENGEPRLMLGSGVEEPFMLVRKDGNILIPNHKQVDEAIKSIKADKIDVLILDPLVEMHEAKENDNVEMRFVLSIARQISVDGNCAVGLAAHTGKHPKASSAGFAGDIDAARGASSQSGVIRLGYTLFSPSLADAKKWKMDDGPRKFVRLDIAKNNLGPSTGEPKWFRRHGEYVNGEAIGVLKPETMLLRDQDLPQLLAIALYENPEFADKDGWAPIKKLVEKMQPGHQKEFGKSPRHWSQRTREAFDGALEVATDFGVMEITPPGGGGGTGTMVRFKVGTARDCPNAE